MADKGGGTPESPGPERAAGPVPFLTQAAIVKLWAQFRAGDVIRCPQDQMSMALAVDGAAKAYRIVCTHCGLASPWFATTPSGLVFRSAPPTVNPSATGNPKEE